MEARRMIECVSRARLVLNVGCRPHVGDSKASSFGVQLMMILMFFSGFLCFSMVSLWLFLLFQLFSCGLQWFSFDFNGFSMVVFVFQWLFSLSFCLFSLIKSLGAVVARPHAKKKARGRAETAVARPHRAKEKGTAELNVY